MNDMRRWMTVMESKSAPLFHGTPLCNLLHIVTSDRLQLNQRGYVSLSRSYHVAQYFQSYADFPAYGGVFVIDQSKLSQRYRILPFHDQDNIDDEAFHDEDEERVFQPIYPLSNYLLSINVDPKAIRHAITDEAYKTGSEDYAQWFGGKRRQFVSAIRTLLRHPALNRWTPRAATNTRNVATVNRFSQINESAETEDEPAGPVKLYHITNKANFKLNRNYAPEDNAFAIDDRSGHKGIYLTRNVEHWVNGHGYVRPFVAEIYADPSALEHDTVGRWGGEIFVPADQFDKLKVHRVVPLDAIARERFRQHGWIENAHGHEFDTGKEITAKPWEFPFGDYRYDKDTRHMSRDEVQQIRQHFNVGHKARLKQR